MPHHVLGPDTVGVLVLWENCLLTPRVHSSGVLVVVPSLRAWTNSNNKLGILFIHSLLSFLLLNGHRPPAKSALQKMARGGEGGSARRENKPYITGAEAKVYATLKSDTIMVIVVYTDSHAD